MFTKDVFERAIRRCDVNSINTTEFLKLCTNISREVNPTINNGGINNVRGNCFEQLFELTINKQLSPYGLVAVKIPNARNFSLTRKLDYNGQYKRDMDSLSKYGLTRQHSNPDYVVIRLSDYDSFTSYENSKGANIGEIMHPSTVVCLLALKSSLRSDRRYQCLHEALTLDKMFSSSLNCITPPFVVVSTGINRTDKSIMTYVADSTFNGKPRPAIDELIDFTNSNKLKPIIELIISRMEQ